MKRQLFTRAWMLLLAAILAIPLAAQTIAVDVTQEGGLWDALEAQGVTNFAGIKSLKVTGVMGSSDFLLIKNQMSNLESIDIAGTNVTEIPSKTFWEKAQLKTVRLPEGITTLQSEAFNNCQQLESVTFGNQAAVAGKIVFPASLRYVSGSVFRTCSKLTHLDFSACTSLECFDGDCSLYNLFNLTELLLPTQGNLRLGWNCIGMDSTWDETTQQWIYKGLETLTLTKAVTSLSGYALPRTLKTLYIESSTPAECSEEAFNHFFENENTSLKVYVPKGSKRNYAVANGWSLLYQYMQENGIQLNISGYGSLQQSNRTYADGNVIFSNQGSATTLKVVPEAGCKLISIKLDGNDVNVSTDGTFTIPAATTIGTLDVAFTTNDPVVDNPNGGTLYDNIIALGLNPKVLRSLKVTGTLNTRDWQYIRSMIALQRLDLTQTNITIVPEEAMKEHNQIREVLLPTSVTEIGDRAFQSCRSLQSFPISDNVVRIGNGAFESCNNVICNLLVLPASLRELGGNAFAWDDMQIKAVDMSRCNLTSDLTYYLFGRKVESVILPQQGHYRLDYHALENTNIKKLTIPGCVTAFSANNVLPSSLQTIYVQGNAVIPSSHDAFNSINMGLCTLYVPTGLALDYQYAEGWSNFLDVREYGFKVTTNGMGTIKVGDNTYNNNDVCFPVIGTVTKLQIVPGAGYDLGTVKFNGNILEPDSEGFITLDASTISGTFEITFTNRQLQLAVTMEGSGSYTIDGQTYTATTTIQKNGGDVVKMQLQPAMGSFVKQVTINGEDVMLKNGGLEIATAALDANTTIAIIFSNDASSTATVTFQQEGFGIVSYGGEIFGDGSTLTIVKDKSITLALVPNGDSNFQSLFVNGTDVTANVSAGNYTLSNIRQNTTIKTIFFSPNMIAVNNPDGGGLKDIITAQGSNARTIRTLKVTGKMNSKDWNYVKSNMSSLEIFDISETDVKIIPESAFQDHQTLAIVYLPSTVISIGNYAFRNCQQLTTIDGCENVKEIGDEVFSECYKLASFPFGNKIQSIGSSAFRNCTSLPESLVMPASLKSMGWSSIFNESSVKSFDLSQCTLSGSFAYNTFGKCTSLLLPEQGDYQMYDQALKDAELTELRLPVAITYMGGENVLPTMLERLYVSRSEPFGIGDRVLKNIDTDQCTLYVPIGATNAYAEAEYWSEFTKVKEYGMQITIGEQGKVRAGTQTLMGKTIFFPKGSTATFEIVPNAGWHTAAITLDGVNIPFSNNQFTLNGDQLGGKLAVAFAANQFNLQLQIAGSGQVKLGSLVYTANQVLTVDSLSTLNFTLEPAEGSVVSDISFNGKESVVQNGGTTYVTPALTANATLTITFGASGEEGDVATYTVATGEGGSVEYKNTTLLSETTIQLPKGQDAVFAIKPEQYFIVEAVKLNGKDITGELDASGNLTVKNVQDGAALEVAFRVNAEISVVMEDGGNLSNMLSETQKKNVTKLTIKGPMWEQDFYTMRDEMPQLEEIDLWEAETEYIPYQAFCSTAEWWNTSVGKRSLISARLPEGTHRIGGFAFAGCSNLKEVNFAELTQLESLEGRTFAQTNLSVIDLSKTKLTDLGGEFYQVKNLENIKLPKTLTRLGDAFNQSSLTEIDLSELTNLKTLDGTFNESKNLVKVMLPEGLMTITNGAFNNCEKLTAINFPKSLQNISGLNNTKLQKVDLSELTYLNSIGGSTFDFCRELTEIQFPSSLELLGNYAFRGCEKLTSVDLSKTKLLEIANNTFEGCSVLESVKLPTTIETIGSYAFAGDNKLGGVLELGPKFSSIGENAFAGTQISVIKTETTTPPAISSNSMPDAWVAAFVPEGYADVYKSTPVWEDRVILDHELHADVTVSYEGNLANDIVEQAKIAPAQVTHLKVHGPIGANDFAIMRSNMTLLYDLDLEDAECSIIPEFAFLDKKVLMNVKLPSELLVIQQSAFQGCSSLKGTLTLPESVTTIGWAAFQGCSSLEKVELSDALEVIRGYAFEGCSSLQQEITFPKNFTSLGEYAFANCRSLYGTLKFNSEFYMFMGNEGYWSSTGRTFENCSNIEVVDMSECENLYQLPQGIFSRCTSLQTVKLPPYLERIEYHGFEENTSLFDVEFPSSLMYIDGNAFQNCSSLTRINLSDCSDFGTLGEWAFANCASLESANLPASLNWIGAYAFSGCRKLGEINVEALNPADLGEYVFQRVHTERCVLSIPTGTYSEYLSAPQWGEFVSMRKAIDVTLDEGAALTYTSGGEAPSYAKRRAFADEGIRRAPAVENQQGNVNVKDGSSLYVAENENVTFYINPDENVSIKQVLFNGEDVTDQLQANSFVTPGLTENTSFKVLLNVDGPITVKELRMLEQNVNILQAESRKLVANVYPTNATDKTILWSSSDEKVATVAADGTVIGVAAGRTTITAKTEDGGFEQKCELVVMSNDYYITLTKEVNSFVDNKAQVPMSLHNAGDAQGIQFDVYLPEGLTMINEWSEDYGIGLSSRSDGHRVTASRRSDGSVRVVVYSTDGKKFRENDGELLSLPIGTRANVGDYDVEVKNIHVSGPNSFDFSAPDYKTRIHVADYPMGDRNGNGEVTVADATNTVDHILERYTERFIEKAADVNTDGVITVSDVTAAIDIVLERPASSPMRKVARISAEPSADNVYIDNVSMANGQQQTIDLKLTNKNQYIAFQCDIMLPEGLTAATNEKQVPMVNVCGADAQTHVVQADYIGSGALRLIVMSMSNSAFAADDNNVVSLTVEANSNVLGQKDIDIQNVRLVSVADHTESVVPDTRATINIVDPATGFNSIASGKNLQVTVEGREIVIVSDSDTTVTLAALGGTYRTLQVKAGENRFVIEQPGVYVLQGRKIIIK